MKKNENSFVLVEIIVSKSTVTCFLYEPVLNIETQEVVVISQCTDDQRFGIPKKLLNNCIPKARFILLSSTITIVVAVVVGAVYHSCTTFSTLQNSILIRFVSLEANLEKKSEQSKRDTRVHIIEPSNP
ncbi:unnamed protein product [Pocillopora meandrina]|uniref:Uncharacterized protein n=1 Tax=Pocillopora meandrina TaxID=46732 RepID=A0AAU9X9C9_9CNID|nr:unnamed protein product [Pocillopora meandrina]